MSEESDFQELIARVRAGDNDACTELERCYGEALRRMARVRLMREKVQHLIGASDVVQSVLAMFFNRAAEGNYILSEPADVVKLLTTMVKRKVNDHRKKQNADKRGGGKPTGNPIVDPVDPQPSPSTVLGVKELFEKVWSWLSAEERQLVDYRLWKNLSWNEIGTQLGIAPDTARKRFERLCADAQERGVKGGGHAGM